MPFGITSAWPKMFDLGFLLVAPYTAGMHGILQRWLRFPLAALLVGWGPHVLGAGQPTPANQPDAGNGSTNSVWSEYPYPIPDRPAAGSIYHVSTGVSLDAAGALSMLSGSRLVCLGETHDNPEAHRVELEIIKGLEARYPGQIAVGMEMFRSPVQPVLDQWTRGEIDEKTMLRGTHWYQDWGMDFDLYRAILEFARDKHIDVIALNPPEEIQKQAAKDGDAPIDVDPYQRKAMEAVFGGHMGGPKMFDSFLRVQLLWEHSMANRIVEYWRSPRGKKKRLVSITGGWHVQYGFGVPKKVIQKMPVPYSIVQIEETYVPPDKADRLMDVKLPPLPLMPANIAWFVDYKDLPGQVKLGVYLDEKDGGMTITKIVPGSAAADAELPAPSQLISIDGQPIKDMVDLHDALKGKHPGDKAELILKSGEKRITRRLEFVKKQ
ncbi:PDZ domain-containing protein [bacterium]|nr:PDZ domain-containing protein [bacterium]